MQKNEVLIFPVINFRKNHKNSGNMTKIDRKKINLLLTYKYDAGTLITSRAHWWLHLIRLKRSLEECAYDTVQATRNTLMTFS